MTEHTVVVRPACDSERRACEELIRDAFWNVYRPGCGEHLIWHRAVTGHPDALVDTVLVAEREGELVGCTMSARGWVVSLDATSRTPVVTVGPIGVRPAEQHSGVGSRLMEATLDQARRSGESAAFLYGDPEFYGRFGFQDASRWEITTAEGDNFPAFMAMELAPQGMDDVTGRLIESELFELDDCDVDAFDASFEPRTKAKTSTQL